MASASASPSDARGLGAAGGDRLDLGLLPLRERRRLDHRIGEQPVCELQAVLELGGVAAHDERERVGVHRAAHPHPPSRHQLAHLRARQRGGRRPLPGARGRTRQAPRGAGLLDLAAGQRDPHPRLVPALADEAVMHPHTVVEPDRADPTAGVLRALHDAARPRRRLEQAGLGGQLGGRLDLGQEDRPPERRQRRLVGDAVCRGQRGDDDHVREVERRGERLRDLGGLDVGQQPLQHRPPLLGRHQRLSARHGGVEVAEHGAGWLGRLALHRLLGLGEQRAPHDLELARGEAVHARLLDGGADLLQHGAPAPGRPRGAHGHEARRARPVRHLAGRLEKGRPARGQARVQAAVEGAHPQRLDEVAAGLPQRGLRRRRRRHPREGHRGAREVAVRGHDAPDPGGFGHGDGAGWRTRRPGSATELPPDPVDHQARLTVADGQQRHVARHVVPRVEVTEVLGPDRPDRLLGADGQPAPQRRHEPLEDVVADALLGAGARPLLLEDDLPLAVDLLGRERQARGDVAEVEQGPAERLRPRVGHRDLVDGQVAGP